MNRQVIETAVREFHNKTYGNNNVNDLFENGIHKIFYKSVMKCDESF